MGPLDGLAFLATTVKIPAPPSGGRGILKSTEQAPCWTAACEHSPEGYAMAMED
jgi:hypothetical protein